MPINAVSVAVIMEVIGLIVKHGVPAVKAMIETWEKDEITTTGAFYTHALASSQRRAAEAIPTCTNLVQIGAEK